VGYLIMTLIASFILRKIEKHMDGPVNFELAAGDTLTMSAGTYSHPSKGTPFDEHSKEHQERVAQELKYGRNRGDR
jgi:putative lysine transport system permease protein